MGRPVRECHSITLERHCHPFALFSSFRYFFLTNYNPLPKIRINSKDYFNHKEVLLYCAFFCSFTLMQPGMCTYELLWSMVDKSRARSGEQLLIQKINFCRSPSASPITHILDFSIVLPKFFMLCSLSHFNLLFSIFFRLYNFCCPS